MFTDGLDTSALQWVRKEQAARTGSTPRTCTTPASGKGSPDITRYDYPKPTRTRGLPPPQLSNVHLHSHALRPPFAVDDDLDESVGSISGGHHRYDDYDDSGDEQESGLYSPSDTSPSGDSAHVVVVTKPLIPDHAEVEDYYDGPLSRKNSSKDGSSLKRDVSGRRDSSGRKDVDNVSLGGRHVDSGLSRKNSFDMRDGRNVGSGLSRKNSFDMRDGRNVGSGLSRKNSFDMRDGRNVGSGLSRKNSFDMRDGRDGAYADSGRFDPYYGRREETLERHGAYTGSGRFDPNYGRTARVVDGAKYHSSREDQLMSSATELSDDTVDTEEDSEEEQQRQPLRRAPVVKVQAAVSYPKIEGYEPVKTENRPAKKEVEIQVSRQRWTATASMPIRVQNSTQQLQSRSPRECLEADKLHQPAADKIGSSSMQSNKANEPVVPHPPPSTTGGRPSAPPFFDVPGAPEPSGDALGGSSIGGSYVTSYEQRSTCEPSVRSVSTTEEPGISSQYRGSSGPPARPAPTLPPPLPVYHSGQAAWQALVAYDACVRLCLRAWARGCMEAPEFLLDECSLLRNCFGLQQLLLQPHEEGSRKGVSEELGDSGAPPIQKRSVGRVKVQVRKLKIMSKPQPFRSSSMSSLDTNAAAPDFEGRPHAQKRSLLSSGWSAVRKMRIVPKQGARHQSGAAQQNSSQRSMAYVNAGAQYVRQVSGMLKDKVSSLRHSALAAEVPQENFTCLLRLRSTPEQDALRLQPGSGETSILLPENPNDDLFLDLHDMKGNLQGRMTVHVASISDDPSDRVRWYNIYCEPEHECVGRVQLFLSYTVTSGEIDSAKWGPVGETKAYDIVLEVAMRVQQFQRRKLRLEGTWLWLLSEFASCYGVSVSYTKLRYLVCIMEVATPTEDCLVLIHDLLCPIIKARDENSLNRQEKRLLVDVQEQVEQLLAVVFENYKSLDEDSISGLADSSAPVCGFVAPALIPAVQIYTLLHDILSVGAAETLRNYFKAAAMKRCKRLMMETDEFVASNNEGFLMDPLSMSSAYQKMRTLCLNVRSEVRADIEIHNKHVLPSSIDLPNIAASIYDMELANRLRAFLVACPPSGPSPPVAELMLSTADFQQDLVSWRIRTQRGVNVKELFHLYIVLWIQDKRLHLLDLCKFDKERCTWVTTQHTTSPSVEEVYDRIKDTLNEYEVIINRWPEYTVPLESAVADVERAVIGALEKQYSEVLLPLKDVMIPKKFSLQYMQKLTRRQKPTIYSVPSQLGVMLNSLKRLLDTLRPRIEAQMKTWVACLPEQGGGSDRVVFGERLNEVTIELRAKYKNYLQSIVEKLADNARLQRTTKLKKILQDTREAGGESDIRERMQPLNTQLVDTISHLHDVFTTRVFVAVCRGFWDRMARDVLHFLENRKGNRSWYKGSSFALGILDDVFATQMQRLQGRALQEKDLEPPRSVAEARSMLSRDAHNGTDSSSLFFY